MANIGHRPSPDLARPGSRPLNGAHEDSAKEALSRFIPAILYHRRRACRLPRVGATSIFFTICITRFEKRRFYKRQILIGRYSLYNAWHSCDPGPREVFVFHCPQHKTPPENKPFSGEFRHKL